jgi:glycosyltransferase involved in cell wall biosynthesis
MHVLQLGPYPPPYGGINRNILAIRDELLKDGHRCSIAATSRSREITPEPDVYHPRTAFALLRLLFTIKYDILHLHVGGDVSIRVLALILAAGYLGRGKNVFSLHSGGYPSSKEGKSAKKHSIRGLLFRRFKRVIAVNASLAGVFERYGVERSKIRVIYPFVHQIPDANIQIPKQLKDFADRHTPFLLTVGLLEAEYDLFMQIDAMERILQEFPRAGLMIVGSGSLEEKLRKAIEEKSYAGNIFLAGDVENRITLHLINDCDILLRTTLYDGDAISIREALFLDSRVIATDNGMRPDGVHLMAVGDREMLVRKVIELAKSGRKKKIPKVADNGNIKTVVELYKEIASFSLSSRAF